VDCLHKECIATETVSVWSSLFILIKNILLVGMALQDVLICVRDRVVSIDLENKAFSRSFIYRNITDSRPLW
jgi:hypothetical protein